jgi:large subunit ribosomal protein L22
MTAPIPEKKTEVRAVAKYVHVSPRKARLVVDHIRGRSVPEARTILAFSARAVAHEIEKVLHSAVSNAETNPHLRWDGDELVIASAFVDEGPTLKRWRARARGHTSRINKRTCHITVSVTQPDVPVVASQLQPGAETPKRARRSGGAAAAPARTSRKKKEAVA